MLLNQLLVSSRNESKNQDELRTIPDEKDDDETAGTRASSARPSREDRGIIPAAKSGKGDSFQLFAEQLHRLDTANCRYRLVEMSRWAVKSVTLEVEKSTFLWNPDYYRYNAGFKYGDQPASLMTGQDIKKSCPGLV